MSDAFTSSAHPRESGDPERATASSSSFRSDVSSESGSTFSRGRADGGTVGALLARLQQLLNNSSPTASLDARLLIAYALCWNANDVMLGYDHPVDMEIETRALALAARRARGEPVARIVGRKEFWGLDFELSPETLVPRPDTETVVEAALDALTRDGRREEEVGILDIGTGSGAILLALLSELPHATGVGIDLAEGAVRTARENAERFGLGDRASFFVGDWTSALGRVFDVIVANPPYIESGEIERLAVEVREHDPHLALDGGPDGLAAYRTIVADLDRVLGPEGRAFLEVGTGQSADAESLALGHGFAVEISRDLAGNNRVIGLSRSRDVKHLRGYFAGETKNRLGNQPRNR